MKGTIMKILACADFSPAAASAAKVAAALATKLGDTLRLVHATTEIDGPKRRSAAVQSIQEQLHSEAVPLRESGCAVEEEILHGAVGDRLLDAARSVSTRMVVLSSHSRRPPERWLVGSISQKLAQSSAVPTLVVKEGYSLTEWLAGRNILRIFIAADFSPQSEAAMKHVSTLRGLGPCEIIVAYVDWPDEETERLGTEKPTVFNQNPPVLQSLLEAKLHERADRFFSGANVPVIVQAHWGRVDDRLVALATEHEANLIVVGTHQYRSINRLWNVSVSRGVLNRAPTNVLCVPAEKEAMSAAQPIPTLRRVLVATDFSPLGNEAIPYAYAALTHGGTVHLLHVVTRKELPGANGSVGTEAHKQELATARRRGLRQLRALIPADAKQRGVVTEVDVVHGKRAAEAICQAAERQGVDLICLSSHGRSGLTKFVAGSVTQAVTEKTTRPLLLVRSWRE
jgi:nucleotide-binding universal stress UspA family protein